MEAAFNFCLRAARERKLEPRLGHRELSSETLRNVLYFKLTSRLVSFGSAHSLPLPRSLCFSALSLTFPRAPFQTVGLLSKLEGTSEDVRGCADPPSSLNITVGGWG